MKRHFLYFAAGRQAIRDGDLRGLGLAHLDRIGPTRQCERGPSGDRGLLFARPGAAAASVGYWPAGQEWAEHPDQPDVWIGHAQGQAPGPLDLQRRKMAAGYPVELGDGREWLLPIVLRPDGDSALPGKYRRADGAWERTGVASRYAELDAAARHVYGQVKESIAAGELRFDAETGRLLELGLTANYYAGIPEMAALGLMTDEGHAGSCIAALDLPAWEEGLICPE